MRFLAQRITCCRKLDPELLVVLLIRCFFFAYMVIGICCSSRTCFQLKFCQCNNEQPFKRWVEAKVQAFCSLYPLLIIVMPKLFRHPDMHLIFAFCSFDCWASHYGHSVLAWAKILSHNVHSSSGTFWKSPLDKGMHVYFPESVSVEHCAVNNLVCCLLQFSKRNNFHYLPFRFYCLVMQV